MHPPVRGAFGRCTTHELASCACCFCAAQSSSLETPRREGVLKYVINEGRVVGSWLSKGHALGWMKGDNERGTSRSTMSAGHTDGADESHGTRGGALLARAIVQTLCCVALDNFAAMQHDDVSWVRCSLHALATMSHGSAWTLAAADACH